MLTITSIISSDLGQLDLLYEELTGTKTNMVLMESLYKKIAMNEDYILIGAKDEEQQLVGSVMGIICSDIVGECQPFMVLENVIISEKVADKVLVGNLSNILKTVPGNEIATISC